MEVQVNYSKSVIEDISLKEVLENFLYRVVVIEDKIFPNNNIIMIEDNQHNTMLIADPSIFSEEEKDWFRDVNELKHKDNLEKAINILVSKGELRFTVRNIPDIQKSL